MVIVKKLFRNQQPKITLDTRSVNIFSLCRTTGATLELKECIELGTKPLQKEASENTCDYT